jgi:hypothetical protein
VRQRLQLTSLCYKDHQETKDCREEACSHRGSCKIPSQECRKADQQTWNQKEKSQVSWFESLCSRILNTHALAN